MSIDRERSEFFFGRQTEKSPQVAEYLRRLTEAGVLSTFLERYKAQREEGDVPIVSGITRYAGMDYTDPSEYEIIMRYGVKDEGERVGVVGTQLTSKGISALVTEAGDISIWMTSSSGNRPGWLNVDQTDWVDQAELRKRLIAEEQMVAVKPLTPSEKIHTAFDHAISVPDYRNGMGILSGNLKGTPQERLGNLSMAV